MAFETASPQAFAEAVRENDELRLEVAQLRAEVRTLRKMEGRAWDILGGAGGTFIDADQQRIRAGAAREILGSR
jgi:hypothetical protein